MIFSQRMTIKLKFSRQVGRRRLSPQLMQIWLSRIPRRMSSILISFQPNITIYLKFLQVNLTLVTSKVFPENLCLNNKRRKVQNTHQLVSIDLDTNILSHRSRVEFNLKKASRLYTLSRRVAKSRSTSLMRSPSSACAF
jgi:hypothetical protein